MKDNFLKVAAVTPKIKVGDTNYNAGQIISYIKQAADAGVKLAVFPELCITGYTCSDLFLQDTLLKGAMDALAEICAATKSLDMLTVAGMPLKFNNRLYNVAAVMHNGVLLGFSAKSHIPNYSEFYEARHFAPAPETIEYVSVSGIPTKWEEEVMLGSGILYRAANFPDFVLGIDICEDLWAPIPPSSYHVLEGATVIANLSASDELTGKDSYRKELVRNQSGRLICGYIYSDAGDGESSTDLVFAGHNIIAENGGFLAESERFTTGMITADLDLGKLASERRRITTFPANIKTAETDKYMYEDFIFTSVENTKLTRKFTKTPFVPSDKAQCDFRCNEILNIQAMGLKKRLEHTNTKTAVIGISGGLDSTLALLVTAKAFDTLGLDRSGIQAVTMPCFGTTDRTYQNACTLTKQLGAELTEISIHKAVTQHFEDIGQDINVHDVTYENSQARQRTLILMDLANRLNGMVIGTGDMSELALGWATYNGDHMSMYGVNCSVPKTLVRYLVNYYDETTSDEKLKSVLMDVLDTPVSPELLPPKDGEIAQKTEDLVGPYELHDFFLYYMMRFGFSPKKIYRLAVHTFSGEYDKATIHKWLRTFYSRFFSQQFKRSCLPDGPKVGSVALSPRGDLRMPSDACVKLWLDELDSITLNH